MSENIICCYSGSGHCLSCVQYCPKQAINVGRITEKREHFPNPNVKADELSRKIIHIDWSDRENAASLVQSARELSAEEIDTMVKNGQFQQAV